MRTSLTSIANRYGTDKGSIPKVGHAYTVIYDLCFSSLQEQPINLLENWTFHGRSRS